MPVFRWGNAWEAFRDLEREMDRLLRGVHASIPGLRFGRQYPPLNLYELEDEYLITAELPGTRPDEFELTIANGILTMKGTRRDPEGIPEDRFRRQERFRGEWQRSVSVPERVDEERLSAEFSNGVLAIHLPKAPGGQPRQIPVAEGGE
ncbi:MAG: Hsp20/alpha crystallin family protein [Planctomycetaceae bacterium]